MGGVMKIKVSQSLGAAISSAMEIEKEAKARQSVGREQHAMKFKPKTRGGFDVRIYATDGGGDWPVLGAYERYVDEWAVNQWDKKGRSRDGIEQHDLVPQDPPVPEPFEFDYEVDVGSQNYRAPKECERFWGHKVRVRIDVVE